MNLSTKPYWLFITVTLPQTLIILYFFAVYAIIGSLLQEENLRYWHLFALLLGVFMTSITGYGGFLLRKKQEIHWIYAFLALPVYIVLLVAYFQYLSEMFPIRIPGWMIPVDEIIFLPVTLTMPVLLHAILMVVDRLTPLEKNPSTLKTTIVTITLPAFWYLAMRVIFPLLQGKINWTWYGHIQTVLFVVLTLAFVFFVFRLVYLLSAKGSFSKPRVALAIKTFFTLILPLLSLLVYNGVFYEPHNLFGNSFRIFGDWSHPVYYGVILLNGILITIPSPENVTWRIAIFAAKAFFYSFVGYFFVVLLPFLPLAIDVVIIFGLGFLLLAPLILFFFHTKSLYQDWQVIKLKLGSGICALIFFGAFSILPLAIVIENAMDRVVLDAMLSHVYEPDYASSELFNPDQQSIRRVLDKIKAAKGLDNWFSGERKPYLDTFYQWMVLDNLTVSSRRLFELESIYFGHSDVYVGNNGDSIVAQELPRLTNLKVNTRPASDHSYYISQIDLDIENGTADNAEYSVKFKLPVGALIQDYYLVMGDKKVPGILSEKKSAMWIYRQATISRRDPGIIYYTSPNEVILRVFPFAAGEKRRTGLEIIHRASAQFDIDGFPVSLHAEEAATPVGPVDNSGNIAIVTAQQKSILPKLKRKPYLHFIVDGSVGSEIIVEAYIARIEQYLANAGAKIDRAGAKISIVGSDSETFDLKDGWQDKIRKSHANGGFFLQRAIKKTLYQQYIRPSDKYPLFIAVTDDMQTAIFTDGLADFSITLPDTKHFYALDENARLQPRLLEKPSETLAQASANIADPMTVLSWPVGNASVAYLPDDGAASLVIKNPAQSFSDYALSDNRWNAGLTLYGMWLSSKLDPGNAGAKQRYIVLNSFKSHVLTPLTAFLSPENDAQKQLLLKKQQQVLSSSRPLDIEEEFHMDEPPLWLLVLCLFVIIAYGKQKTFTRKMVSSVKRPLA